MDIKRKGLIPQADPTFDISIISKKPFNINTFLIYLLYILLLLQGVIMNSFLNYNLLQHEEHLQEQSYSHNAIDPVSDSVTDLMVNDFLRFYSRLEILRKIQGIFQELI